MRIVQISDTHLLAPGGVMSDNLSVVMEFINTELRPDLVVHTGDVIGIWPDDREDREAAAAALGSLQAPLLVVPGNHDVGEPGLSPWMGLVVTSERVAAHGRAFGEVPFIESFGEWGILGLNSQLFGSGLAEEEEQWDWLERTLAKPGGPLLLFLHRPLWAPYPGAAADNMIPDVDSSRMLALPGAERLRAVGSGHLHCHRIRQRPEVLEVWAPATACTGDLEDVSSVLTRCGVVEWLLDGDRCEARLLTPSGLDERAVREIPELVLRIKALWR